MSPVYQFSRGDSPLLVSMPHVGLEVPPAIAAQFSLPALTLPDTDWHVERLYDFLPEMGASTIQANYSRYVVDLNRSPDTGHSLYPGQNVTQICTTTLFDQQPVYQTDCEPTSDQVADRIEQYWHPYHQQLRAELTRIKDQFGYALLWDAHSIRSQVPRFFSGKLADFNWGNADGIACSNQLTDRLQASTTRSSNYTSVVNGRFKGGYITRTYGRPAQNIYAIQLELSQDTYMYDHRNFCEDRAARVRPLLKILLKQILTDHR